MKAKIVAVLAFLFCASAAIASAEQSPQEIDTVMAKVYAASAGNWRGEARNRSIDLRTEWSAAPTRSACRSTGANSMKCEGKLGPHAWTSDWRVQDGVEYQREEFDGRPFVRRYYIKHAWFTDAKNHGWTRQWFTTVDSEFRYEGVDTMITMGDRLVSLRKVRRRDSTNDYQYMSFGVEDRVN